MLKRPVPPEKIIGQADIVDAFIPAPDVTEWLLETFVLSDGALANPDHAHLEHAEIGVLWTNSQNSRKGRRIVGQCELGQLQGAMGKWAKARAVQQVTEWFGHIPDFIFTFDAPYASSCEDDEFCALVEHELYHAAQDRDAFGAPKFRKTGKPVFTIRGHDVEEFVGVVRRYGSQATGVAALVEAANNGPEIAMARISHACGTCRLRAA